MKSDGICALPYTMFYLEAKVVRVMSNQSCYTLQDMSSSSSTSRGATTPAPQSITTKSDKVYSGRGLAAESRYLRPARRKALCSVVSIPAVGHIRSLSRTCGQRGCVAPLHSSCRIVVCHIEISSSLSFYRDVFDTITIFRYDILGLSIRYQTLFITDMRANARESVENGLYEGTTHMFSEKHLLRQRQIVEQARGSE